MREILSSKNLPPPAFRYSPLVKAGPFYQTAGMIGFDPDAGHLVPGGLEAETRQIFANLSIALPDFGLSLEHLVSASIYTTKLEEFSAINAVWEEVFANIAPPARVSLGVTALPLGATIEIEFRLYKSE